MTPRVFVPTLFLLFFIFYLPSWGFTSGNEECEALSELLDTAPNVAVPMTRWMKSAAGGDKAAQEIVGKALTFHIRNVATHIADKRGVTLDEATLDEITQLTLIAINNNYYNYDHEKGNFGPWIYLITQNAMSNQYRNANKDHAVRFTDMSNDDESRIDGTIARTSESAGRHERNAEDLDQIREALPLLRSRDITFMQHVFIEGRPMGELEEVLNLSKTSLSAVGRDLVEKLRYRLQLIKLGIPELVTTKLNELSVTERDLFISVAIDGMDKHNLISSLKISNAEVDKGLAAIAQKLRLPKKWYADPDFRNDPISLFDYIDEQFQPKVLGTRAESLRAQWKQERPRVLDKAASDVVRFLEVKGRYPHGPQEIGEITGIKYRKLVAKESYAPGQDFHEHAVAKSPEEFRDQWNQKRLARLEVLHRQLSSQPDNAQIQQAIANLELLEPTPTSEGLWRRTKRFEVEQAQNWSEKVGTVREVALDKLINHLSTTGTLPPSVEALREITGWPEDKLLGRDQYAEGQPQEKNTIFSSSAEFKKQWTQRLRTTISELESIQDRTPEMDVALANLKAIEPSASVEGIRMLKPRSVPKKSEAEALLKRERERKEAPERLVEFIASKGRFPANDKEAHEVIGFPRDRLFGEKRFAEGKERESQRIFASPETFKERWSAAREQEIARLQSLTSLSDQEEIRLQNLLSNSPNDSRTGYSPGQGSYKRAPKERDEFKIRQQEQEVARSNLLEFIAANGRLPKNDKEAQNAIGFPNDRLLGRKRYSEGNERASIRVFDSAEQFKADWSAAREEEIARLQGLSSRTQQEETRLQNLLATPPNASPTGYSSWGYQRSTPLAK